MPLEIDHVIVAVRDLETAAARLRAEHGLEALPGGRHPGHGTANMIVPLGPDYLELMAVVDADEAAASALGRFVVEFVAAGPDRPMAVCLRTDDIAAVGSRLGLEPLAMTRTRPDGVTLAWHLAGLDGALGPERLPFFIEWHVDPADHPGRGAASHEQAVSGLAWVEVGADPETLSTRLGGAHVPLRVVDGPPGPQRVAVATPAGDLVI